MLILFFFFQKRQCAGISGYSPHLSHSTSRCASGSFPLQPLSGENSYFSLVERSGRTKRLPDRFYRKPASPLVKLKSCYCKAAFNINQNEFKELFKLTLFQMNTIDYRSYTHNLSSCEIKARKKIRLKRDQNPWLLRYRNSTLLTELFNHMGAGQVVSTRRHIRNIPAEVNIWKFIYLKCGTLRLKQKASDCDMIKNKPVNEMLVMELRAFSQ